MAPREATAVASLYRRYRSLARHIARRFHPHDPAAVDDVVQDVFLSLCEAHPRLDTSRSLSGWIGRVTTNRCLTLKRRASVAAHGAHHAVARLHPYVDPASAELETRLLERSDLARVLVALDRLPERQARALRQHGLGGATQTAIAEALGVTKGYVSRVIKGARLALRRLLEPDAPLNTGVAGSKAPARPRPQTQTRTCALPPPPPLVAQGRPTPRTQDCTPPPTPPWPPVRRFARLDRHPPTPRALIVATTTGGVGRITTPIHNPPDALTAPSADARIDAWSGGTKFGCPSRVPLYGRARPRASSTTLRTKGRRPVIPPAAWGLVRPRPPPAHRSPLRGSPR